jgi:hypothetical protein
MLSNHQLEVSIRVTESKCPSLLEAPLTRRCLLRTRFAPALVPEMSRLRSDTPRCIPSAPTALHTSRTRNSTDAATAISLGTTRGRRLAGKPADKLTRSALLALATFSAQDPLLAGPSRLGWQRPPRLTSPAPGSESAQSSLEVSGPTPPRHNPQGTSVGRGTVILG